MKWLSSLLAQKREHERTKKKSETYSQEISKEVNSTQVEQSEWLGLNWVKKLGIEERRRKKNEVNGKRSEETCGKLFTMAMV